METQLSDTGVSVLLAVHRGNNFDLLVAITLLSFMIHQHHAVRVFFSLVFFFTHLNCVKANTTKFQQSSLTFLQHFCMSMAVSKTILRYAIINILANRQLLLGLHNYSSVSNKHII